MAGIHLYGERRLGIVSQAFKKSKGAALRHHDPA
jgi:hypothetical protein